MTLAANTALSTRSLTYYVRIYTTPGTYSGANVLLQATNPTSATGTPGIDGIRISKSFDSPVPVCQLELSRVPTWITRGQGITVDVGYNGLTQRLFTGFIQSRERRVGKGTVQCMGRLWTAFRTVQIGSRSVDGVTVSSAIGTILDYVGITDNRIIDVPAFTLGSASSPVLERMPASQMLQMLMDIDGCRIYETGTGQIIVKVIDEAPAPVAFKTYTTNANATARVLEASDREDPEYYRNRVIVTGATVTEGVAPDETSRTITATATNTGSALVQPALPSGTYVDAEYNNHLIDTDAKAASVAIRLLTKFARIPRQLQIELAGDPQLDLGQTIAFVIPELDLNDRGFISGIEHVIDNHGYVTRLTDFRGAGDTGGTLSQNPIASFTFKSEREVFGSVVNVFAALDASNSFDPDGTIASYAWSDNQTTSPEIATLTTQQVLVRADTSAWTGSWSVTLTVTDSDGLTGATTLTIPYTNTEAEIVLPAIYAAINNNSSATLDGAVNWNDSVAASGTIISVGARPADGVNVGHALFGGSDGKIYRTTDGCATAPSLRYTSAAGVAINDIKWDWRNPLVCWAIDENCILYISLDAGVTWGIYGGVGLRTTLSLAGALGNQIGLPAGGGVYIFGGNGAGTPLIAYDAGLTNNWVQVIMTGDAVTDFTGADATMRIVDYTAGFTQECMILSWTSSVGYGASLTAVYTTPTGGATSRAFTRASTTFGALKTGRYIVSDNVAIKSNYFLAAFANRSVWYSTDGVAWTEVTNVMPASVVPWHAIGMTGSTELTGLVGMFGVFMIAASDGIYKYTPRIDATASYVRPSAAGETWPASAVGKKLAIGASGAAVLGGAGNVAAITTSASPRTVTKLTGASWSTLVAATGITDSDPSLFCLSPLVWFATNANDSSGDITGNAYRSADGGATWAVNLTQGFGFVRGPTGRYWAFARQTAGFIQTLVYYSDDSGANWTLATTIGNGTSQVRGGIRIACHPTDPNIVSVWGGDGAAGGWVARATADPTTSGNWSTTTASVPGEAQTGVNFAYQYGILANGRYVWAGYTSAAGRAIKTSDDNGVTWTTRSSESDAAIRYSGFGHSGSKVVVYRDLISGTQSGKPLVSNNSATTFAVVTCDAHQTFTGDSTSHSDAAVYDAAADTLYAALSGTSTTYSVVKLTPVSDSGVWSNVTYNIGSGSWGNGNLSVVPL